jgi:DnaD/phage-associated family protein
MNYIKELNAFYDWLELNELSPSAINLWYALMHINNKAGWIETFTVAESVLCVKTSLTDRTLRKVRNELKQKGRIDFVSRKGKAPTYKIISFYTSENNSELPLRSENNSAVRSAPSSEVSSEVGSEVGSEVSSALIKLNKTKQNEAKLTAATRVNYFDEYMICFGKQPNPIQIQEINNFIDQDGLSVEVVCEAFKKAAEAGAHYGYARSILNSWANKGITSLGAVENEQQSHQQRKQQQRNKPRYGAVRTEKLPEWLEENKSQTAPTNQQDNTYDFEAEKAKLEAELLEFKRG